MHSHFKRCLCALLLCTLTLSIGAEEIEGRTAPSGGSDGAFATGLVRPESPGQLLSNFKIVVQSNALVRESTFLEPTLTKMLGGGEFKYWANGGGLKMVEMRHFASTFSDAGRDPRYSVWATYQDDYEGRPRGMVSVPRVDPSVRVDTLLRMFGEGYSESYPHSGEHEHPSLLASPTVPEGNKLFSYKFVRGGVETFVSIQLAFDGSVESLGVVQQMLKKQ